MSIVLTGTLVKLLIILLALVVGVRREGKLTVTNRIFLLFLVVALPCEIMDYMMGRIYRTNFLYYHVFRPLYYALMTIALAEEMGKMKRLFRASIPLVFVAAVLSAFFLQSPTQGLNTIVIILISMLQIIQSLLYIARLFDRYNWEQTLHEFSFWIAIAILLHSISSFLSLGIHNLISPESQEKVIRVLIISEWIFYLSFVVNFAVQKQIRNPEKESP